MSSPIELLFDTDEEMVTCSNCGNCWDGYAQCSCYGIQIDDHNIDEEQETEQVRTSHPMTLRSHTKVKVIEDEGEPEQITHPECWNEHTHYEQCGQSCPCCRAEVGDEWGACLVCSKKY
jgi:hypothetical protein